MNRELDKAIVKLRGWEYLRTHEDGSLWGKPPYRGKAFEIPYYSTNISDAIQLIEDNTYYAGIKFWRVYDTWCVKFSNTDVYPIKNRYLPKAISLAVYKAHTGKVWCEPEV